MFTIMLFMFCFFLGFVVMFYYLLSRLDNLAKGLSDEHAQLRVLMRAMESRLDKISQVERLNALLQDQASEGKITMTQSSVLSEENDTAGHDPLLHLSFDQPRNMDSALARDLDLRPPTKNWDLELLPEQKH